MRHLALALAGLLAATGASAQAPALKPGLQGLQFLVGRWSTPTRGRVADTGGASSGEISFTLLSAALVRRARLHAQQRLQRLPMNDAAVPAWDFALI